MIRKQTRLKRYIYREGAMLYRDRTELCQLLAMICRSHKMMTNRTQDNSIFSGNVTYLFLFLITS